MSFRKGDVFHVVDTLHNGVVGSWQVYRIGECTILSTGFYCLMNVLLWKWGKEFTWISDDTRKVCSLILQMIFSCIFSCNTCIAHSLPCFLFIHVSCKYNRHIFIFVTSLNFKERKGKEGRREGGMSEWVSALKRSPFYLSLCVCVCLCCNHPL